MPQKKKVLIYEPDEGIRKLWQKQLKGAIEITWTTSLRETEEGLVDDLGIDAVVITASNLCFLSETAAVVKRMQRNFGGPMIVASSLNITQDTLKKAGCNYACEKKELAEELLRILGL